MLNDTSVTMYGQPLKVTQLVKFLVVIIDSHLNMKLHVKHIERACLVSRINVTRLNTTSAALLIRLYKIIVRPYMDYACTALTALKKHKDIDLKWLSLCYARRAVDSAYISDNEFHSCCTIVSVEQRILTVAKN